MSNRVRFAIECEMEEHWVDTFLSFLMGMQMKTVLDQTGLIAFCLDREKDFKPTFDFENLGFDFDYESPIVVYEYNRYGEGPALIPCWGKNIIETVVNDGKEEDNA